MYFGYIFVELLCYLLDYYSNIIIYYSIFYSYYNNRNEAMTQSGFKTHRDIIREVIIYSEYNLDVYLWSYCVIYEIIIAILLFIILFFTVIIIIEMNRWPKAVSRLIGTS